MNLKLGGCSHHSERISLVVPLGSSEVILGSSFVLGYLRYMDVKRNSLCDILKHLRTATAREIARFENRLFFHTVTVLHMVAVFHTVTMLHMITE